MNVAAALLALAVVPAPAAHAAAREPAPQDAHKVAGILRQRLAGAWRELGATKPRILGFSEERCVQFSDDYQRVFTVTYGEDSITRTPCGSGGAQRHGVRFEEDEVVFDALGSETRYARIDPDVDPEAYDSVRLDPFVLGSRAPSADEIVGLCAELDARVQREQAVRRRMGPLMALPPAERNAEALDAIGDEMQVIDRDNTRYLVRLLEDVGWIDADRFGEDARQNAFLIVQHSPSLRLMGTVLPLLESEARADPTTGMLYAYLYDRYQLALCAPQRFGTQLHVGLDGTHYVVRLEQLETVDERREAFGMGPLEDYLDLFRRSGTEVVIGDVPDQDPLRPPSKG